MKFWIVKRWPFWTREALPKRKRYITCDFYREKPKHYKGKVPKELVALAKLTLHEEFDKEGNYDIWSFSMQTFHMEQKEFEGQFPEIKMRVNQCIRVEMKLVKLKKV